MENGIHFLSVGYLDKKDLQSSREEEKPGGGQGCLWQRALCLSMLPGLL